MKHIIKITLFLVFFSLLIVPSSSFEDTFQYYPNANVSNTWSITDIDYYPQEGYCAADAAIVTSGATYSRSYKMRTRNANVAGYAGWCYAGMMNKEAFSSNYFSFNLRTNTYSTGGSSFGTKEITFYNNSKDMYETVSFKYNDGSDGLWEFVRDGEDNVTLYINGIDEGIQFTFADAFSFASINLTGRWNGVGQHDSLIIVDDITTSTYGVGIGQEAFSRQISEIYNDVINISWKGDGHYISSYTNSEYKISITKDDAELLNTTVKEIGYGINGSGNGDNFTGFANFLRSDLTLNDTVFGTYYAKLTKAGTPVASDYFTLSAPDVGTPTSIFNESFQNYPSNDITPNWSVTASSSGRCSASTSVVNRATQSRSVRMHTQNSGDVGASWCYSGIKALNESGSNYWAFNLISYSYSGGGSSYGTKTLKFYDVDGVLINSVNFPYSTTGLWELIRVEETGDVALRINAIDKGTVVNLDSMPYYIEFYLTGRWNGYGTHSSTIIIDDISTSGNYISVGSQSTNRTMINTDSNDINVTWTVNTFPYVNFTSSELRMTVDRYIGASSIELYNETIKNATDTTIMQGIVNFNRSILTENDTIPGTYKFNLLKSNVSISSDYFIYGNLITFQSLSISPSTFPQSQSTTITAWITGVTNSNSVIASIFDPNSNLINISLSSIGSDLYQSQFTQTNTPGRHYVTTITADSTNQNYNLDYPFTVTPTNTENTGSSSSSSSSSTPIPTSSPTPTPTTNPLDNIIPNLPDSLTQNNPLENFFESLPTSIKQTISYTLTPSLYLFDILFLLLIVILLYIIYNRKLEPSKIIFSTLTFFIVLRILNINLTTMLTGVT